MLHQVICMFIQFHSKNQKLYRSMYIICIKNISWPMYNFTQSRKTYVRPQTTFCRVHFCQAAIILPSFTLNVLFNFPQNNIPTQKRGFHSFIIHTYTHIHAHTALPCLATRKEGVCSTFSPRPVHKRIVRVTFPVFLCHSLGEMRELRASKEISLHFMARPFQDPLRFISPQWRDQTV